MSDKFSSTEARASYGIGRQLGDQLAKKPFSTFELEAAVEGFMDGANDKPLQVSADDINAAFRVIQAQIQSEKEAEAKELGAAGMAFLEKTAQEEGVVVLESGLQYKVLVEGDGEKPTANSTVSAHYHGTLVDGTIFDSSVDRGVPAELPVNGVIPGWSEALQLMPVGSKWRLYIPYHLAYGEQGAGGKIEPYSALVFDLELLSVVS